MRIRLGWQAAEPVGHKDAAPSASRRIQQGPASAAQVVHLSDMALPQPDLAGDRVEQTRIMFQEFLDHLDRLGLAESATHVSLGFERFLSMYPPQAAHD